LVWVPDRRRTTVVLGAVYGTSLGIIAIGLAMGGRYPGPQAGTPGASDPGHLVLLLGLFPWFWAIVALSIPVAIAVNGALLMGLLSLFSFGARPAGEETVVFPGPWDPDGHYAVLGLGPLATCAEVRRAYHRLALLHHPDHGGDLQTMQALNAAWDVLGDAGRRAAYSARAGKASRTRT
jgi:hypothetical protein